MTRTPDAIGFGTLALATVLALAPGMASGRADAGQRPKLAPLRYDGFLVTYWAGARLQSDAVARERLLANAGRSVGVSLKQVRRTAVGADLIRPGQQLDAAQIKRLFLELQKDPAVRSVSINGYLHKTLTPNDPRYPEQWNYLDPANGVQAPAAWDLSTGTGSVVAVLDTGITDHPDLDANMLAGYDFVSSLVEDGVENDRDGMLGRDDDPHDPGDWSDVSASSWHGTHVAGTVAAATNNNLGVAGVAFGARVQPVRVLGTIGGSFADIGDAIVWASGGSVPGAPGNVTPVDVINLSLGGTSPCEDVLQASIDTAIANGSVVVVAAGNDGGDVASQTPANCDGVITVASTAPDGSLSGFSNVGAAVDVAAPGGSGSAIAGTNILSTRNDGLTAPGNPSYGEDVGTSMSAPHVSAVAALVRAVKPAATVAEIAETIVNTAYKGAFPAGCSFAAPCGSGIVDARRAVAVARGDEPLPDAPPAYPPPDAVPLTVNVPVAVTSSGEQDYFKLDVPADATALTFTMSGASGDPDLYVRFGALPGLQAGQYDCRPFALGANELCADDPAAQFRIATQPGTWYVMINPFLGQPHTGVSLLATYQIGVQDGGPAGLAVTSQRHRPLLITKLAWRAGAATVDIHRNGVKVRAGIANTRAFSERLLMRDGLLVYRVCNAGTDQCSATVDTNGR